MALAVRVGGGQGPEAIELSVELATEAEGIEALIERGEIHTGSGREDAGGAQALVGGLGPIVDAPDAGTVAVLAHELLHRLEEVDVQAGEPIDAPELGIGGLGGEAIIADELAHDGPVLLLDVGAVVLFPGAAAGEGDPALPAVVVEALVDALPAVIAVEAEEWHGPALAHAMHAPAHPLVPLAPDGLELDPGGGDVARAERAEIEVLGAAAAVSHEVDFEKPGAGVVPLGEGAEGNLVPEPGAHVGGRGPAPRPRGARGGEQPAEGGGTDLPDELVDLGRQPQLTVAREPIEELGHEGMEPLRPDAPGRLQRTSGA